MAGGQQTARAPGRPREPGRLFWAALAAPGILWLALLFIVPFYAMLAIAAGHLNPILQAPAAAWNPLQWSAGNFTAVIHEIAGTGAFVGPIILRTLVYVTAASVVSLLIGYPAAYFVARFAGPRKGLFLVLLIAPFWISYMMRMLAWIDLLQTNGYVNKALGFVGISAVNWLGGNSVTVVLGLVYGYIPYLILVLYAGLDRIDPAIFASAVLVFSGVIDDFVLVDLLSSSAATQLMSVIIYSNTHGGNGGPALNALATIMLVMSFVVTVAGYFGYRWLTRGERTDRREAIATIAGV